MPSFKIFGAIAYVKEKRGITTVYNNIFKAKCLLVAGGSAD